MSCSLAVEEQITYGIIQAYNEATFSFTSLWIKWFAETSVVCWGLNLPSLSLCSSLPFHPCPTTFPKWPVFWVCFLSIYIAACVPQPLINITTIPDFSRKVSMWEREHLFSYKSVKITLRSVERRYFLTDEQLSSEKRKKKTHLRRHQESLNPKEGPLCTISKHNISCVMNITKLQTLKQDKGGSNLN